MKLLRRQTRRTRALQKIKDQKIKQGVATVGATMALSQVAMVQTTKTHAATNQQAFLDKIAPLAQELAGKNDLYASVMIAQAVLESAWGKSGLSSAPNNNLFGMKGLYNGQSVNLPTLEDDGTGKMYRINDNFRRYPSYYESLEDYVDKIKTLKINGQTFYAGAWRSNAPSYKDATKWLTGRYATDTAYASKLNYIIETYGLTRYDAPSTAKTPYVQKTATSEATKVNTVVNAVKPSGKVHIVTAGETLWRIATTNGLSVSQLKTLNGLTTDTIFVGQTLRLQGENTATPTPVKAAPVNNTAPQTQVKETPKTSTPTKTVEKETVSAPSVQSSVYTVQKGDTLYRIANKNGISVAQLKSLNGLSSDLIFVGQSLKLETTKTTPKQEAAPVQQTVVKAEQPVSAKKQEQEVEKKAVHVVKSGDTLWRIANENGMSVDTLKSLNGLVGNLIRVGQSIKLK